MPESLIPEKYLQQLDELEQQRAKQKSAEGRAAAEAEVKNLNFYSIAANQGEADPSKMGEIEKMLSEGNRAGLEARLGPAAASRVITQYVAQAKEAQTDKASYQSPVEVATDFGVGAYSSLQNTVWGLSTLGMAAVNPDAAAQMARRNQDFNNEVIDSLLSDATLRNRRFKQAQDEVAQHEHLADQVQELNDADGQLVPSLAAVGKRFVKDMAGGIATTFANPGLLPTGVADTAASMIGMSKVTGMLETAGKKLFLKKITGEVTKDVLEASLKVSAQIERGALAGSNALFEGAGQGMSTMQDVLNKTPQELLATSAEYRDRVAALRASNPSMAEADILAQAQNSLASKAGLVSGAITGIAAAAVSDKLGEQGRHPFELLKHPEMGLARVGQGLKEVGSEFGEETLQGFGGQAAGNFAKKTYVDPNQDMLEGVGWAGGEGGALAVISTGGMKGPAMLRGGGEAVTQGTQSVVQAINTKAGKIDAKLESESNVAPKALTAQATELKKAYDAPEAQAGFKSTLVKIGKDLGAKVHNEAVDAVHELTNSVLVTENPKAFAELAPEQVAAIRGSDGDSRANIVDRTAKAIIAEKDPATKSKLYQALNELLAPAQKYRESTDELDIFQASPEAQAVLNGYRAHLNSIDQLPSVQKAKAQGIDALVQTLKASANTTVQEATLTPETKNRAQAIAELATIDPNKVIDTVSPAEIQAVLRHGEDLNPLTPAQQEALDAVAGFLKTRQTLDDAEREASEKDENTGAIKNIAKRHLLQVRGQVINDESSKNEKGQVKDSARQRYVRVIQHMQAGNVSAAKREAMQLANMAQNHVNKLAALGESRRLGNGARVDYDQWTGSEWKKASTNPISTNKEAFLIEGSKTSEAHGKAVELEARLLSQAVEGLATAYPALGIKAPTPTKLNLSSPKAETKPAVKPAPAKTPAVQKPAAQPPTKIQVVQKELDKALRTTIESSKEAAKTFKDTAARAQEVQAQHEAQVARQAEQAAIGREDPREQVRTKLAQEEQAKFAAQEAEQARQAAIGSEPSAEPTKSMDLNEPTTEAQVEAQEALSEKPVVPAKKKLTPEEREVLKRKRQWNEAERALESQDVESPFVFNSDTQAIHDKQTKSMGEDFDKDPKTQVRDILTDSMTGLLSRTGAELTPFNPTHPFLAVFSFEGKKVVNDEFNHRTVDGVLRTLAQVLAGTRAPMKIGSDVQGMFRSLAEAEAIREKMQKAVGPNFQIRVAGVERKAGQSFQNVLDAAYKVAGADTAKARAEGKFAARKAPPMAFLTEAVRAKMPADINWDYDPLNNNTTGISPDSDAVQEWIKTVVNPEMAKDPKIQEFWNFKKVQSIPLEADAKGQAARLDRDRQLGVVYRNPVTGLPGERGFNLLVNEKKFKWFASLDMRALAAIDRKFGKVQADRVLRIFGELLTKHGGNDAVVGHLHGDEFAVAMKNEEALREFLKTARELLNEVELYSVKADGTIVTQTGVSFAFGVGTDIDAADANIAENKKKDAEPSKPTVVAQSEAAAKITELWRGEAIDLGSSEVGLGVVLHPGQGVQEKVVQEKLPTGQEVSNPLVGDEPLKPMPDAPAVTAPVETPAPKTTAEYWPNLFRGTHGKFVNWFHKLKVKVFRDGKPPTTLLGKTGTLGLVREAAMSAEAVKSLKPDGLKLAPEQAVFDHYQSLLADGKTPQTLGAVVTALQANMETFLNKKRDGKTIRQHILDGSMEPFHEQLDGKAANLFEVVPAPTAQDPNAKKIQYNPELIHQAALASMQWALTASQRQIIRKDDEDLEKDYGFKLPDGIYLNKKLADALSFGSGLNQTKHTLSAIVRRFWGIQSDSDVGLGFSDGVSEAVASELLRALETAKFLKIDKIIPGQFQEDLPKYIADKAYDRYIVREMNIDENGKSIIYDDKQEADRNIEKTPNPVYDYPELLEELVVTEPEMTLFYDDDVVPVKSSQLGNPDMGTTGESKKARENMQDVKFRMNEHLANGLLAMSETEALEAFGTVLPEDPADQERLYNKNDLKAIQGQNRSILGAIRELRKVQGQMKGRKTKKYQYAVNNVNRIMMLGAYNPQSSKIMRESIMSTWSTLNMADKTGDQYKYALLSLSQLLGQKVHKKTFEENVAWAETALNGGHVDPDPKKSIVNLAPVVEELVSWLDSGAKTAIPTKLAKATLGGDFAPMALMGLVEMAKVKQAERDNPESLKAFETPLYFEADGMTNGPFNSMGLLSTGAFTKEWVENIGRGGMAFSGEPVPANVLIGKLGDIYTASMKAASKKTVELLKALADANTEESKQVGTQAKALLKALSILVPGEVQWEMVDGKATPTFDRKFGKNPLTVLIYGSGVKGVAGKLVGKLTDAFYEKMSLVAKANIPDSERSLQKIAEAMFPKLAPSVALEQATNLFAALDILRFNGVKVSVDEETHERLSGPAPFESWENNKAKAFGKMADRVMDPGFERSFTFHDQELKALQSNFKHLVVTPMFDGIQDVLGKSVFESGQQMIAATKLHSLVAQKLFFDGVQQKLNAKFAALRPSMTEETVGVSRKAAGITNNPTEADKAALATGKTALELAKDKTAWAKVKSEFLSKNELREIFDSLGAVLPLFKNDGQSFLLAKTARGSMFEALTDMAIEYSRSFDNLKQTPPDIMVLTDAGVAAVPYLTIGMGDARMVRALYMAALANSLQVFDGINIPAGNIAEHGARINAAASQAFQGNVFQTLSKAFDAAVEDPRVRKLLADEGFAEELAKTMFWQDDAGQQSAKQVLSDRIQNLKADLLVRGYEQEARRMAMNQFKFSTDQMAGTYQPSMSEGGLVLKGLTPFDAEDIAKALNKEYEKALSKLIAHDFKLAEKKRKFARNVPSDMFSSGTFEPTSGTMLFDHAGVRDLMSKLQKSKGLNATEKMLLRELALKNTLPANIGLVTGTAEQIAQFQKNTHQLPLKSDDGTTTHGYYNPDTKLIYLISPTLETLVHELIHAGTVNTIEAYYQGKLTDEAQVASVKRLENLMEVFLQANFRNATPSQRTALNNARNEIKFHKRVGNKAFALDEFMSWALANRDLGVMLGGVDLTPDLLDREIKKTTTRDAKANMLDAEATAKLLAENLAKSPSRLAQLAEKVWNEIKRLLWGKARGKVRNFDTDLLSHIRFNTAMLIKTAPSVAEVLIDNTMAHRVSTGEDAKLDQLDETFNQHIAAHLGEVYVPGSEMEDMINKASQEPVLSQAHLVSLEVLKEAQVAFPELSDRAKFTFQRMVMAFGTEAEINPQAMTRVQELYTQVMKTLTPEDFGEGPQAKRKFEFLAGYKTGQLKDARNRSPILPTFLALAAVDESFGKILESKQLKAAELQVVTGPDTAIENMGTKLMESLGNRLAGIKGQPANVRAAIGQLIDGVTKSALDEKSFLAQAEERELGLGRLINDGLVGVMKRGGLAAYRKGDELLKSNSKIVRGIGASFQALSFIANEQSAAVISEGILAAMDKSPDTWAFARDLAGDLLGRVTSQGVIYDMLKQVRHHVSQTRSTYREHIPAVILSKFKTKPTESQQDSLFRTMGRYDLASLYEGRDSAEILELVANPAALQSEIGYTEAFLRSQQPLAMAEYSRKIAQYVNFVQTGVRGGNLLTNAWAISKLLGEKNRVEDPNEKTVIAIDQLITLKLLAGASEADRQTYADLFNNEREGIEFTLNYLKGQRTDELKKATVGLAKYNHYKGAIDTTTRQGHLTVVEDTQENHRNMRELGYARVGEYKGSNIDPGLGVSRSYYFALEGRAQSTFSQGIAQTAYGTAYGVQTLTGMPLESNAGVITDPSQVARIAKHLGQEQASAENLSPIYDENGEISAFIRTLSQEQKSLIQEPQHLALAIGRWCGRQVEESWASTINDQLVNHLNEQYEKDTDKTRYVDVFDPEERKKDPILNDAVRLLPFAMRHTAERVVGTVSLGDYTDAVRPKLYVRRNLLTAAIGYRQASVSDLWTGTSRWKQSDRDLAKNALKTFLGPEAFRKMLWFEKNWQAAMHSVRTNIVVRSVIVPAANFMSGLYQLKARGVSLAAIVKGVPSKLREIEYYTHSMAEKVRLEAELRAAEENPDKTQILRGQLKTLLDSQKNLSIWPLIEAGEFSSITDVGEAVDNREDNRKTVIDKLAESVDKMPPGLRDMARQGYMARDTGVFKALEKATQYSDFVMKSIYYDHLRKNESKLLESTPGFEEARAQFLSENENMSEIEADHRAREVMARARVTEEFVNYDLPTGRNRGYLENMGLLWFLNFKLRASKIGLSMIRNNPFQALMMAATPSFPGADSPINGNLFSKLFQGVLGYSIGPQMALQPIALNPWYNLIAE